MRAGDAPGWLRVFLPLDDRDFLVDGEEVFYNQRYHSAILLRPAFELISALIFIVWLRLDVGLTRSIVAAFAVMFALIVGFRLVQRIRRSRRDVIIWVVGFVIVAAIGREDGDLFALLVAIAFGFRFARRWLKWRFYRRLLVTNRRVIEIDGLVGSSVATMPLFRITDALLARSAVAEILGYALFKIESAGQDQALGNINFLADADEFHHLVIQLSTTAKTDTPSGRGSGERSAADRLL